jgi:tRNA-dihydrouridine synthase
MRAGGVSGVLVGRGVLRNPWILAQASDLMAGRLPRVVTRTERGQFLLDYIELLMDERVREPEGFRHAAPVRAAGVVASRVSHDRWVVNKIRALATYYTKGFEHGSQLRTEINRVTAIAELRHLIEQFFSEPEPAFLHWRRGFQPQGASED